MSLNGLDSPKLEEAFEKAYAGPGGWFWIKYASRDEVELLCRGSSGSEGMREAAEKEPDDWPLYGFIRFRRRNILIKYIPEETSRVLKARSTVHFQSIVERFNPHDTEITITSPKELRDHALTSACSTHAATASISSSNSSLRQRRLTDIAESADEEEPINPGSPVSLEEKGKGSQGLAVVITTHDRKTAGDPGSPVFLDEDHLVSPRSSAFPGDGELRRRSTNSIRPSPIDIYEYPHTPKVRLGPRLHVESPKRPHTSSERSKAFPSPGEEVRPVASVPKSVQIAPRKSPGSTSSVGTNSLTSEFVKSAPVSLAPVIPQGLPSSVASPSQPPPQTPLLPPSPSQPEGPPVLSPEKQRLMRALQLRRQTMVPEAKEHVKLDEDTSPSDSLVNVKEKDEAKSIQSEFDEDIASNKSVIESEVVETSRESIRDFEKGPDANADQGKIDTNAGGVEQVSRQTGSENMDQHHHIHQSEEAFPIIQEQHAESAKVRGEPESDAETESDLSVEVSIAELRPISIKSAQQALPNIVKSIYHTVQAPKPPSPVAAPGQTPPKVLKRADRPQPERVLPAENPVIETARSVSAPFLKSAREANKPAVVRKVNVSGGGSVLQRIRQLEMLSVGEPSPATPPISPPRSRNTSPIPSFASARPVSVHSNTPTRAVSNPPQPHRASTSYVSPIRTQAKINVEYPPHAVTPPAPPKQSPPPKMEIIERNNRPELQVTTTITRDESPIAHSGPSSAKAAGILRDSSKERASPPTFLDPSPTRQSSDDVGSAYSRSSSRRQSVDTPTPSRSPSSRDLENLSESHPSTTSRKSSKKGKKGKDRRGSSSSSGSSHRSSQSPTTPKSPKSGKGFLRRMSSSLSKKTREVAAEVIAASTPAPKPAPTPAPIPGPVEPARKTYLLAGWINVQLPDTMLWRRRCMKIDSDGWLFLSLTDDEDSPQTRKYHIPSEVRTVDLPDVDEQELPHSVRLFLGEGGTLQCACQNRSEQKEVLGVIRSCIV